MDDTAFKNVPPEVPNWLAYSLGEIHNGIKTTNGKVDTVIKEVKKINGSLTEEIKRSAVADSKHNGRIDDLEKKNPGNTNQVTFRWLLEKLALPIVMLVIGIVLTLLFA